MILRDCSETITGLATLMGFVFRKRERVVFVTCCCGVPRLFDSQCPLLHPIKLVRPAFRAVYQSAYILPERHVVSLCRFPGSEMLIRLHKAVQRRPPTEQLGWTVFLQVTHPHFGSREPVDMQVLSWAFDAPSKEHASDRLHTCSAHAQLTACTLW
jgi:hypothetical protein